MPLCADSQWLRIDEEANPDGHDKKAKFGCMVRSQGGGMVVGRIVRTGYAEEAFTAQKWRLGKFIDISKAISVEDAIRKLEADA